MSQWWEALLPPTTRPGSRTVLCDPEGNALAIELARRGYRLLVLHDGGFDVAALRLELRDLGLSPALMGSHVYDQDGAGLVSDFHELFIFCAAPVWLAEASGLLKKGATILWQAKYRGPAAPPRGEPVPDLPEGLLGLRFPS